MKYSTATTSIMSDLGLDLETQPTTADLTPMLDTIFLIILLLLATLMNSSIVRGFPVNLPAFSEETAIQKESNSIEISIDKDGFVYVAKEKVELLDIAVAMKTMIVQDPSQKILLRADSSAAYGRVAQVLCHVSNSLPDKQIILVTQKGYSEISKSDNSPKVVKK